MNQIEYLHAPDPGTLNQLVDTWIGEGWDLQGGIVVIPAFGYLGQCVVRYNACHEYKLVQANTFESLARELNKMKLDGWDIFQQTVVWSSILLQWVCRAREHDLRYVAADYPATAAPDTYFPEPSLRLVEHVQKIVALVPYPVDILPPAS